MTTRVATLHDIPVLTNIMELAIAELQKGYLTPAQIQSSRMIMGLDTSLVEDGTYYIVFIEDVPAGCGGWSRRETLYGGDHTPGRRARLLDPQTEAARIRAMYTHPAFVRQGVGSKVIELCEDAARAAGFSRTELMSTLAGEPLYRASGYAVVEKVNDNRGGEPVPLLRMSKVLTK